MSEYVRITDRKIELTDEGVEALMADYTPTTKEVPKIYADYRRYPLSGHNFDRWLAEVKATERERIIQLLKEEQSVHYALGNHYGEIAISAAINYIEGETK